MSTHANPMLHLPHVLYVLGPSSLTLYKHMLGRSVYDNHLIKYLLPKFPALAVPVSLALAVSSVRAGAAFTATPLTPVPWPPLHRHTHFNGGVRQLQEFKMGHLCHAGFCMRVSGRRGIRDEEND